MKSKAQMKREWLQARREAEGEASGVEDEVGDAQGPGHEGPTRLCEGFRSCEHPSVALVLSCPLLFIDCAKKIASSLSPHIQTPTLVDTDTEIYLYTIV